MPFSHAIRRDRLPFMAFAAILILGLSLAWESRWLAEDSYISFRYARNLLEGQGLVFNAGERVEGYTNFLWTVLVAGGMALGATPEHAAIGLGLASTALGMIFLFLLHRRLFGANAVFPAAIASLAVNHGWRSFSTSGMETPLVTALIVTAIFLLPSGEANPEETERLSRNRLFLAGLMLVLACMTRPDAALFLIVSTGFLLRLYRKGRLGPAEAAWFFLPLLIIYLPYFAWRFRYYGYLLPNTFYAKSAGEPYVRQGLLYLANFLRRYSLWVFLPLWPLAAIVGAIRGTMKSGFWLIQTACVVYIAYVVRVGGGFMEARFFIPVLPFLYLILEGAVRILFRNRWVRAIMLAGLVAVNLFDVPQIDPGKMSNGITDEASWEPAVKLWLLEGEAFGRHMAPGTVVATDAIGAFGFASRLPIVDLHGLTDVTVAHLAVSSRGRPGHEKWAPMSYLRERGTTFIRTGTPLQDRNPDWWFATNFYYLLTEDPVVRLAFFRVVREIDHIMEIGPHAQAG